MFIMSLYLWFRLENRRRRN